MNETLLRLWSRLLRGVPLRSMLLRIAASSLLRHLRMLSRLMLRRLISLVLHILRLLRGVLMRHRLRHGLRMLDRLLILRSRLLHFRQWREDRLARRIVN